jgi:hypothetical protein
VRNFVFCSALILGSMLVGCGDSKIRELRSEFTKGCQSTGGKKAVCSCVFEKLEHKYSREELLDLANGGRPEGFVDFTLSATLQCARDN